MEQKNIKRATEIITICDDADWIWNFVKRTLDQLKEEHVRIPSSVPLRQSWQRFKDAGRLIIYWENKHRSGGAIVEEILDVSPVYDIADNVIVLTSNPTHEDVVYFSELGIRRIIRLRNRDKELVQSATELVQHIRNTNPEERAEIAWRRILRTLDHLQADVSQEKLDKLEDSIEQLSRDHAGTARYLDAKATVAAYRGSHQDALRMWQNALDKNPNYYRTFNNLIRFFMSIGQLKESFSLMQKMQSMNRSSISRLVNMGEIHVKMGDDERAEHFFKSALDRDNYCSGALNGLAEIRFRQGDLDESRKLLSRSSLAYKVAQELNSRGIVMVKLGKYQEAMEHYTKAQYVIPHQEKSPLLFYNIGLCYHKWDKNDLAKEFLKIALIKEPNYKKAEKLLERINTGNVGQIDPAA